jgi:hypothetical protein
MYNICVCMSILMDHVAGEGSAVSLDYVLTLTTVLLHGETKNRKEKTETRDIKQ